jgi:hypothetical protein
MNPEKLLLSTYPFVDVCGKMADISLCSSTICCLLFFFSKIFVSLFSSLTNVISRSEISTNFSSPNFELFGGRKFGIVALIPGPSLPGNGNLNSELILDLINEKFSSWHFLKSRFRKLILFTSFYTCFSIVYKCATEISMNLSTDLKFINQYESEPWTPLPKQPYDLIRNMQKFK